MYENLGFTENIFNTKPLTPQKEGLEKFTGRVQDIKNFSVDISSTESAVIVVTGHRGVGKTSFVNIMEYAVGFHQSFIHKHIKIKIPALIPCYHKIQIEPPDDPKSVLLKSLSSLLFSINRFAEGRRLSAKIPKDLKKLTKWVSEAALSETTAGQISIAGPGGGISRSEQYKSLLEVPTTVLQNKIQQTVRLAKDFFEIDGILLNINNVDILDTKAFCTLFNQLRDYLFDISGLWSVIIGQPGLYSSLYQQAARVSEIVSGQETKLDPLSEEDIMAILKKRQKIHSKSSRQIPNLPIHEDFIREIYKNSDGEIRSVLKACDDIVRAVFKENPNMRVIHSKQGRPVLKNILQRQLSPDHFKPKDREILREILNTGAFRPRDYKKLKLKSAVEFTNRARNLIGKNLLKKETKGNAAEYLVAGVIHLAKYAGVEI